MIKEIKQELLREYSIKLNEKIERTNRNTKSILENNPTLQSIEQQISVISCDKMLLMLEKEDTSELDLKIEQLLSERKAYLTSKNIPANYDKLKYDCNECNDTGYDKNGYCICFKQKLSKRIFYKEQTMTITDVNLYNYHTDFFEDEHQRKEMDKILNFTIKYTKDFIENKNNNLIFFGESGLGKTYLLSALANTLIDMGKIIVYQSSPILLEKIKRASFTDSFEEINDLVEHCDLLIIDDLGKEYVTEYTKSTLFNIINNRYNSKKPIAISTNLTLNELEECYGEPILSRLLENSTVLLFEGTNLRTK